MTAPKIEPRDNGPFMVRNLTDLRMPDGSAAETKPVMALCRCGNSKNKPFCDGSHKKVGFNSAPQDVSGKDRVRSYEGQAATVHFNSLLCSHSARCAKQADAIFNTGQRPWIQPDNGTLDEIREVIAACPSGALRYNAPGQESVSLAGDAVAISVAPNGPYHVSNIPIDANYWAEGQNRNKYVLCRCGLSKNKPFCDGTHKDESWTDA